MLLKSRISNIDANNIEVWKQARLFKFTSSNIWKLAQPEGFGKEGIKYIRSRVFEYLARIPSEAEFTNQYTADGLVNEGVCIRKYATKIGAQFVITQKLIYGETDMFSSTPDAIWIQSETQDQLSYDGEIWQVKSYAADHHMECIMAETPEDLRRIDRKTYFQVLDEMTNLNLLIGKAIYYHPALPEEQGGMHVITFDKRYKDEVNNRYPIIEDITFLKERKKQAVQEFHKLKDRLCTSSIKQ